MAILNPIKMAAGLLSFNCLRSPETGISIKACGHVYGELSGLLIGIGGPIPRWAASLSGQTVLGHRRKFNNITRRYNLIAKALIIWNYNPSTPEEGKIQCSLHLRSRSIL